MWVWTHTHRRQIQKSFFILTHTDFFFFKASVLVKQILQFASQRRLLNAEVPTFTHRNEQQFCSKCIQSEPGTKQLSSTSHSKHHFPPVEVWKEESLFLPTHPKAFNGHCLACYLSRWHDEHMSTPETAL